MICFFEKEGQFQQVEVYLERPYTLACIDATGASQTERFGSATDLNDRWGEVQHDLREAGWSGPFGRDGRATQSPGRRSDGR